MENTGPIRIDRQAGHTYLVFPAALSIAEARALYENLSQILTYRQPVVMAVEQLERVDGAALQVLAGFCQTARLSGVEVTWQGPSANFQQAAHDLDLASILELTP